MKRWKSPICYLLVFLPLAGYYALAWFSRTHAPDMMDYMALLSLVNLLPLLSGAVLGRCMRRPAPGPWWLVDGLLALLLLPPAFPGLTIVLLGFGTPGTWLVTHGSNTTAVLAALLAGLLLGHATLRLGRAGKPGA